MAKASSVPLMVAIIVGCMSMETNARAEQDQRVDVATADISYHEVRLERAIMSQITPCWSLSESHAGKYPGMVVMLRIDLKRDGSVIGRPKVVQLTGASASNGAEGRAFAEAARGAVLRCSPFKLPPEMFDVWKSLELNLHSDPL